MSMEKIVFGSETAEHDDWGSGFFSLLPNRQKDRLLASFVLTGRFLSDRNVNPDNYRGDPEENLCHVRGYAISRVEEMAAAIRQGEIPSWLPALTTFNSPDYPRSPRAAAASLMKAFKSLHGWEVPANVEQALRPMLKSRGCNQRPGVR